MWACLVDICVQILVKSLPLPLCRRGHLCSMFLASTSIIQRTRQEQVGLTLSQRGVVHLNLLHFAPTGKRARSTIAARIVSGHQARGRALPQVIPDFMGPASNLELTKHIIHAAALPPVVFPLAQYAIDYQPRDCHTLIQQRSDMCHACSALASSTNNG